jgi:hypothetical protein
MSGLLWTSYIPNPSINASYYTGDIATLYNNAISFFNTPPTVMKTGTVTSLQNPSPTDFNNGGTEYTAVTFNGWFRPDQTGEWTFHLSYDGMPCDDFAILFLGPPGSTIVPNTTFPGTTSSPSATQPIAYNTYFNAGNQDVTLTLQAGKWYPILLDYSQSVGGYVLGLSFTFGANTYTDFTGFISTKETNMTCFKEGTPILTNKGYCPVETLKPGDLIQTSLNGYKAVYKAVSYTHLRAHET